MDMISSLETLKEHTYTPNSFYDMLIAYMKAVGNGDFIVAPDYTALVGVDLTEINASEMTQAMTVRLKDSAGNLLDWYTGTLAVSIATSADGVAKDESGEAITSVDLVNGVGSFTMKYTGTWVNDETVTVTIGTSGKVMGITLTAVAPVALTVEPAG